MQNLLKTLHVSAWATNVVFWVDTEKEDYEYGQDANTPSILIRIQEFKLLWKEGEGRERKPQKPELQGPDSALITISWSFTTEVKVKI